MADNEGGQVGDSISDEFMKWYIAWHAAMPGESYIIMDAMQNAYEAGKTAARRELAPATEDGEK